MEVYMAAGGLVLVAFCAWTAREVINHFKPVRGAIRFPRMVRHLGMSVEEIADSDLAFHMPTAQRLCLRCKQIEDCDQWLCRGGEADEAPRFCPNAAYLHLAKHPAGAVD